MTEGTRRKATYADVLAAPEHMVAEILAGVLYLRPRPGISNITVASALGEELGPPFKRGKGGPGGWIIFDKPELHLAEDVLVPDLAGWRRSDPFPDAPCIEFRPDWVCEILSPATEHMDRTIKLPIYAREQVPHVWLIDPRRHTLELLRLESGGWLWAGSYAGDQAVRAEPFDAIVLSLGLLWADITVRNADSACAEETHSSSAARVSLPMRSELAARKLAGEQLSPEDEEMLAALNAALQASMVKPTPESPQVTAAVEVAKLLLAYRAAKAERS